MSQDAYAEDARPGAFGSALWQIAPAVKPNDLLGMADARPDLYGEPLHAFLSRAAKGLGVLRATSEDLPERENRVELAREKDELGFPRPRVVHTHGPDALALAELLRDEGARLQKAAGALETWAGETAAWSLAGGAIMGADPTTSVTDSYGRTHDVPNLLVAGASLFPTSGAVPPIFTIHALASRTAERLLAAG